MSSYEQAPEELKFIVRNLDEWPSDKVSHVYIMNITNEICFNGENTEDFDFSTKESIALKDGANKVTSDSYTRKEYETAREAYIKMNYKPEVGDLVDVDVVFANSGDTIKSAQVKYISDHVVVYEAYGVENHAARSNVILAKHKPEPTTQELMLDDWRKSSLSNSHDELNSCVCLGDVFDELSKAGWDK